MNRLLLALVALCSLASVPALAQTATYNSTAPTLTNGERRELQADVNGNLKVAPTPPTGASSTQVQGVAVTNAAAVGNPVQVGGVYTSFTLDAGDAGPLRLSAYGHLITSNIQVGAGADATANTLGFGTGVNDVGYPLAVAGLGFNGSTWDRIRGDANGQVVQPALSSTFWSYAAASGGIVSSTADVAVKTAGGAGVRNFVCTIDITHATLSASSEIVIKDGASVLWRGLLQTAATDSGAGAAKITFQPCLRGTANTAVNVAMITSVTGGTYVNLTGYTGS